MRPLFPPPFGQWIIIPFAYVAARHCPADSSPCILSNVCCSDTPWKLGVLQLNVVAPKFSGRVRLINWFLLSVEILFLLFLGFLDFLCLKFHNYRGVCEHSRYFFTRILHLFAMEIQKSIYCFSLPFDCHVFWVSLILLFFIYLFFGLRSMFLARPAVVVNQVLDSIINIWACLCSLRRTNVRSGEITAAVRWIAKESRVLNFGPFAG